MHTHLKWLIAADTDADQLVTRDEIASQLQLERDANSNGLLEIDEGAPPAPHVLGDYEDLEAWTAALSVP